MSPKINAFEVSSSGVWGWCRVSAESMPVVVARGSLAKIEQRRGVVSCVQEGRAGVAVHGRGVSRAVVQIEF